MRTFNLLYDCKSSSTSAKLLRLEAQSEKWLHEKLWVSALTRKKPVATYAKPIIVPGTSTNDLPASDRRLSEHIAKQSESRAIPSDGPQARPHKFQRAHELLRFEWQRRQAPLVTWQDEDVLP